MKRKYNNKSQQNNLQQTISFFDEESAVLETLNRAIEPVEEEQPAATTTPEPAPACQQPIHFASFGSGSSGNCAYLGTEHEGILIDAGVDPEHVFADLAKNGITPDKIKGIILTHDHADHVRYVYAILRKYLKRNQVLMYCTPKVLRGMKRKHSISNRIEEYHKAIFKEIPFVIAGMKITAFDVSHDAFDNMGYMIEVCGRKFVVSSDMGQIGARADFYMRQAELLMIESNYDSKLLDGGRYPEQLKNRIRNPQGHLDNKVTAAFVADMYSPALKYVFLCHLSNDNNAPEIALQTTRDALEAKGVTVGDATNAVEQRDRDVQLYALPRYTTSLWFVI